MSDTLPPNFGKITHYVMKNSGDAVFVKEAEFFLSQGGSVQPWGKAWTGVTANTIEEARTIGRKLLPSTNNRPGPPGETVAEAIDPGPPWGKATVEDDETNYANHPLSIAEIRSDKTDSGRDWTPRDALISALRDIDSGVNSPKSCVICFGEYDETGHSLSPSFYQATQNRFEFFGILEAVKFKMAANRS